MEKNSNSEQSRFLNRFVWVKNGSLALLGVAVLLLLGQAFYIDDSQEPSISINAEASVSPTRSIPEQQTQPLDLTQFHLTREGVSYEQDILELIGLVKSGNLQDAQTRVDQHLQEYPKSRVGHLIKSDVLAALGGDFDLAKRDYAIPASKIDSPGYDVDGLRDQLKARWLHNKHEPVHRLVPASLIDFGDNGHALVADMKAGRLYLYKNVNGQPQLVSDYYLTVGSQGYGKEYEGDNKTPIGVYFVNDYLHPDTLPDLYGDGAFPVDYPNVFDRAQSRTGYGIWLHGTPSDTYARSPWASEGCFVISNDDFKHIREFVSAEEETPVILAEEVNWVTQDELALLRKRYLGLVEAWRTSWESLDMQAYLGFYSQDQFNFGRSSFRKWADNKLAVNERKTFVQVELNLNGVFLYPGEQDMFVVSYTQNYLSNNFAGRAEKQQYWQRDERGHWRIIFEG
ncbi:MAG: L,D-transpeptidase family protein [Pseudomonadota bacterium]